MRLREVHDRPDDDLAVLDDRSLDDVVEAHDRGLRVVEDRRREHRAVDAAVGDGEDAALELRQLDLAVAGALAEITDRLLDAGEVELVAVADHGDHQALVGADGHADVEEVVLDDVVAVELGVDGRDFLHRLDGGLHEEGHEAELDSVFLEEFLTVAFAQLHDRGHVDLVEGGEHRRLRLGLDKALGDLATQRRHPLAGGATGARGNLHGRGGRGGRSRGDRSHGLDRGLTGERREHVALGDAAGFAGAFEGGGVEAGLRGEAADGGRDFGGGAGLGGDRGGDGSSRGGGADRGGRLGGGRSGRGGGSIAGGAGFDAGDDLTNQDFGARLDGDGDASIDLGGAFGSDLIGFVGEQGLAFADRVPVFHQPSGEQAAGDGFSHGGDFDVDSHEK